MKILTFIYIIIIYIIYQRRYKNLIKKLIYVMKFDKRFIREALLMQDLEVDYNLDCNTSIQLEVVERFLNKKKFKKSKKSLKKLKDDVID